MAAEEQMYALAKFIVGNSCVASLKLTKLGNPDIFRKIVLGLSCMHLVKPVMQGWETRHGKMLWWIGWTTGKTYCKLICVSLVSAYTTYKNKNFVYIQN